MRRISFLTAALTAVFFVAGLAAQAKPDFAGKWTLVPDANEPAPGAGGGGGGGRGGGRGGGGGGQFCGQECTITQDGTMLTVVRTTPNGEQKAMYKLDGSESKNMQAGRGGETEVISKAMWEGNKVSITTTRAGRDGANITTKTMLSVAGGQMEVENTVEGGQAPATKQMYKKG
jgi:hypothetical protein